VPKDVYAELDAICATVPAGARGVIFTPWLNGERTPVDDHTVRGGLHNLSLTSTMDDVVRAVFEGVAMNSRWVLGYVERFVKRRLDPLSMIGGGAKSDVWCQIFADVLDRTVRQVEDPLQGNARGAAFIAAVALGRIQFDEIPGLIRYANTFVPNPEHRERYDEIFSEFVQLYKRNRSIYSRLNRV
jgi:xylulokinase